MKVVAGPDLSSDVVTTTAASRSFSVNPTIAGIFEVRERVMMMMMMMIMMMMMMMLTVAVLGGPYNCVSSSSQYQDHPAHPVRELHGEGQRGLLHLPRPQHDLPVWLAASQHAAAQVSQAAAAAGSVVPRAGETSVLRQAGERRERPGGLRAARPDPAGGEAVPGGDGEQGRAGPGDEADTRGAGGGLPGVQCGAGHGLQLSPAGVPGYLH